MRCKGHTLIELIITIGLFGLLLSALFNIFIPGLRIFKVGSVRSEIQNTVDFSLRRLNLELSSSANACVTINSADIYDVSGLPHSIAFLSAYKDGTIQLDYNTCTMPVWQKHVIYYYDKASRELRRKEIFLSDVSPFAKPLSHQQLYDVCVDDVTYKYTVIAKNISSLSIYRTGSSLIKIEVGVEKKDLGFVGSESHKTKQFIEVYPHNGCN